MTQFILDLCFTLVFVILLRLLSRIKDKTFENNRESYKYTISGISALLLVSILRLLKHQSVFGNVPFLSEPVYLDLAEAIGIVAGVALMIGGVSIWLPLKKKRNGQMEREIHQQEALLKIIWEILENDKINRIFNTVPRIICAELNFSSAAVFKKKRRHENYLWSHGFNIDTDLSNKISARPIPATAGIEDLLRIQDELGADGHIPLQINNLTRGVVYFWKSGRALMTAEEQVILRKIERAFKYRLTAQFISLKQQFLEETRHYIMHMKGLVARRKDIKSSLNEIQMLLKSALGAEYMSLAILDRFSKNMRCFTTGLNSRVLLDQGSHLPIENTQIDEVFSSHRSLIIEDVTSSGGQNIDSLFLSCGQKCLMALPLVSYGRVIAVITLGNSRPNFFSHRLLQRAEMLAAVMAPAVESEIGRSIVFVRDRYLGALSSFNARVEASSDINSLLEAAADTLMENIRTTMIRVSMLNRERTELSTCQLKTIRPFDRINVEKTTLAETLTPWHCMAIRENQPLLINQKDASSNMDENEARVLVFEGMQSVLIVPIAVNGITFGLITLGEMRNWMRYSYDASTILFCKEIASRVAGGIKIQRLGRALMNDRVNLPDKSIPDIHNGDILNRLKSPVTSLRGSLDLLRVRGMTPDDISRRVMESMEESTNQIISMINKDEMIPEQTSPDLI
nr:GAF domain-containing protein [candidate division Zixibacteria bacterium]